MNSFTVDWHFTIINSLNPILISTSFLHPDSSMTELQWLFCEKLTISNRGFRGHTSIYYVLLNLKLLLNITSHQKILHMWLLQIAVQF